VNEKNDDNGIKSLIGFTLEPYEVEDSLLMEGKANTYKFGVL